MEQGRAGIYFRRETKEVCRIGSDSEAPPGDGWAKVSEEPDLGLLEVREILRARNLVDDPREVYWYGLRSDEMPDGITTSMFRNFKRSSEQAHRKANTGGGGLWSRLTGVFRFMGGGLTGFHGPT
ncbi:MAG: hypothetical protein V3S20_04295 [Dehalococcoidia bacterium]